MEHLSEENSIRIGFCGGFYCHTGSNAASEGLYALPRKISGARHGGSSAQDSRLHKSTSNKLLSVTVLWADLFLHFSPFPPRLLRLLLRRCGSGSRLRTRRRNETWIIWITRELLILVQIWNLMTAQMILDLFYMPVILFLNILKSPKTQETTFSLVLFVIKLCSSALHLHFKQALIKGRK